MPRRSMDATASKPRATASKPRARSGTTARRATTARTASQGKVLGFRGTSHPWWALPMANNKFDYLIADGAGHGNMPVKTLDQMQLITTDFLLGNFGPISVPSSSASGIAARRTVARTTGAAVAAAGAVPIARSNSRGRVRKAKTTGELSGSVST